MNLALAALLVLASADALAFSRPKTPGQLSHTQCAQKVQAPGLAKVCVSTVHGVRGRFLTLTDARGNGSAYSIIKATAAPSRGPERITFVELQLTGDVTDGVYKGLSAKGAPFKAEQRFDVRKGALIQLLKGDFTRVGAVNASAFKTIFYPQ